MFCTSVCVSFDCMVMRIYWGSTIHSLCFVQVVMLVSTVWLWEKKASDSTDRHWSQADCVPGLQFTHWPWFDCININKRQDKRSDLSCLGERAGFIGACTHYSHVLNAWVKLQSDKIRCHCSWVSDWWADKEGNILFNGTLNTFYLWLYGVRHMVKDHSARGEILAAT